MRTMQAEIERLHHEIDVQCSSEYVERILKENERLRVALAKSCEEGRDEMYDCGYNRLRVAYGQLEAENEKLKECIAEWQKDSALNGRW
jgi:hypothetical protein